MEGLNVSKSSVKFLYYKTPELDSIATTNARQQGSFGSVTAFKGKYFQPTGKSILLQLM
jgi:hypothetical protein